MWLFLKILCGMANSVGPDQTAPSGVVRSGSPYGICNLFRVSVYEILRTFTGNTIYVNINLYHSLG